MQMSKTGGSFRFRQRFTGVGIMLLLMGLFFSAVGIIVSLLPIGPEDIHSTVNGVAQVSTEETVFFFRMVFLLSFGLIGLALVVIGLVMLIRARRKQALIERLRRGGSCLNALITEYVFFSTRVNEQRLGRLYCIYTDMYGTTFVFKSDHLRMDPRPYLPQGQVLVYQDNYDPHCYYVDVEGSMGLGKNVVEL